MVDEPIDQEMWDTFARCVPDERTRQVVALRVLTREARQDARAVTALATLAATTPDELDAAFDRAVARGTFQVTAAPDPLRGRVASGVRNLIADLDDFVRQVTGVFVSPLMPSPAVLGPADPRRIRRSGTFGDDDWRDENQTFRFEIPEELTDLGLGAHGSAELDGGTLNVRLRRRVGADLPPIVIVATAEGEATDATLMHVGAAALTASLPWDCDATPSEILLAIASPT